jgi:AmmeMemoRadiSam system protein B/AmmeMemoRadiSam system protein A
MRALLVSVVLSLVSLSASAVTRPPAVAGSFYERDPMKLRKEVERMLEAPPSTGGARAVVVPHAGYVFSGAVAGEAFATLETTGLRRVILLGPSHHRAFKGAALPARDIDSFSTPLGDVKLDRTAVESLRKLSDFSGPPEAHGPEHCLEVELPFVQVLAPRATIVPILVGNGTDRETARRLAKALVPLLDESTVVVASSDFTHYGGNYRWTPFSGPDLSTKLVHLGELTAGRLAAIDPAGFTYQVEVSGDTVCGVRPLMVLVELLSHAFDGSGRVLEVTTSGHRVGSWGNSVTYAAIAFRGSWSEWSEPSPPPPLGQLTRAEGASTAVLARATLQSFLTHDGSLAEWFAGTTERKALVSRAGAFVTLNHRGFEVGTPGRLRACMGVIEARQPLSDAVIQAAVWAAQDPRFPRLKAAELDGLDVEVSVLSPARPIAGPNEIEVGTHGVILEKGNHRALFLPQVATEQGWDRNTMLDHLAQKAGLPANTWRDGASFEVFTAQVFGETH